MYGTNFNTYGRFAKTLTLNCDSSAVMNFQGDMMNDNSFGYWRSSNDTLFVSFDTITYPDARFTDELTFLVKGKKLERFSTLPQEQYDELVIMAADSVKLPSYEKLNKQLNNSKTPTNFKGNSKRQYFKLTEQFDCEE